LYYPGTMGCRQHCASPPRAESLTCRSSSHLLLWFESNGSHRHLRVTLFNLARSRLRRFEQSQAPCLRSAAGEKRGFRPRGEPPTSHLIASFDDIPSRRCFERNYLCCLRLASERRGPHSHGEPSTPHACASRDTPLRGTLSITIIDAPQYTSGDSRDRHARDESAPLVHLCPARRHVRPYTAPSASHVRAPRDRPLVSAFSVTAPGALRYAPSDSRDLHSRGEPSPFVHLTPSPTRGHTAQAG
jgi:hypothetical protein